MRAIAIDPGFGRCGVAVVEETKQLSRVYSTCLETTGKEKNTKRMYTIVSTVEKLIQTYQPDVFVIEGLFFSNNQKTALQVAEVRGALLYIAEKYALPIYEIHPSAVKIALTGFGKATKVQVMYMVKQLLSLSDEKRVDDEYDALALGIAGLAECVHQKKVGQ
jgi:crossover junction endodeoxyribonuclease RuvC